MPEPYCPEAGDFIWIELNPTAGREQRAGSRVYVLSPRLYNEKSGLCVVCPITNQAKGYPFEVALPPNCGVTGVALADQVRSLSWPERRSTFISAAPDPIGQHIRAKVRALIGA